MATGSTWCKLPAGGMLSRVQKHLQQDIRDEKPHVSYKQYNIIYIRITSVH